MIEWWMMKNDEQWWMTKNEWWSIMNDEWWKMNKLVTVPTPISWSQCQHQAGHSANTNKLVTVPTPIASWSPRSLQKSPRSLQKSPRSVRLTSLLNSYRLSVDNCFELMKGLWDLIEQRTPTESIDTSAHYDNELFAICGKFWHQLWTRHIHAARGQHSAQMCILII